MAEAIYCRLKIAFMLTLFALPVLISMWNRYLDVQIEESRYLPPLTPFELADAWDDLNALSPEFADVSESIDIEIP